MPNLLVIGYGNSLRQDDGVGLRAADLLQQRLGNLDAEILHCHQLTPELVSHLSNRTIAVFMDAAVDRPLNSVTLSSVLPLGDLAFSHHLTPQQLLVLAHQLNGHAPRAFAVTAGVNQFAFDDALTVEAENCAHRMADVALQIIQVTLPGTSPAPSDSLHHLPQKLPIVA